MDSSDPENQTSNFKLKLSNELVSSVFPPAAGIFSPKSKHLLTLPSSERSGEAFLNLLSEMEHIKFFRKFSNNIKKELAQKILYIEQDANSILLQQGEEPLAMYVILSGVISLKYKLSQMHDCHTNWPEIFLTQGDYFGHQDFILNRPASFDAKCIGYSELIQVKKEDFRTIQKQLEDEKNAINRYIHSNRVLGKFEWTDEEYEILEIFSDLVSYFQETDICHDQTEKLNYWSYFVASGECRLVRKMDCKNSAVSITQGEDDEPKTFEFELVRPGFYFNVGEDFGDNHVFATAASECLMVPRLLLKFKNKELLNKMAMDLYASLPSDEEIISGFLEYQRATDEVDKTFEDIFIDKPWILTRDSTIDEKPLFIKYV